MSLQCLPQHAAIHVISDLHMGGKPGFQILRETGRLAGYIRNLASKCPEDDVALILNGDVFDTLAEDLGDGVYVAAEQAQSVLERIMKDEAFAEIWTALGEFARTPQRTLVFIIGNHDVEMAFPAVQRMLLERLAGPDLAARARMVFSTTGAGYTCRVGSVRVYCTHGNEFDSWNYNRYEDLSRLGRHLNADQPFDPGDWKPNAGTKMVKEVMNRIKSDYRWIDILKPETEAALSTLLVIAPEYLDQLSALPRILAEKKTGDWFKDGRLSTSDLQAVPASPPRLENLIGPNLRILQPRAGSTGDLLQEVESSFAKNSGSEDGVLGIKEIAFGLVDLLVSRIRKAGPAESLRLALLDWLKEDHTFEQSHQDTTCQEALKHIGRDIDIIITGHTHLARAISMNDGKMYFNSGTWTRLMEFTPDMLKDEISFKPIYKELQKGRSMEMLDKAMSGDTRMVRDYTTEVEICVSNGKVIGRLNQITGDGRSMQQLAELLHA